MFANGFPTGSYEEQVSCRKVTKGGGNPPFVIPDIFNRGSRGFCSEQYAYAADETKTVAKCHANR